MEEWKLTLNKYQRDNLLWLLNLCGYPWPRGQAAVAVEPFTYANTGDWLGEIHNMIEKGSDPNPNQEPEAIARYVHAWAQGQKSSETTNP